MKRLNEYIYEWKLTNDSDVEVDPSKNPCVVFPGWTLEKIKQRYKGVFDNIHMSPLGNVVLGTLTDRSQKRYLGDKFTIYTDTEYNGGVLIRRQYSSGVGKMITKPTLKEALDKLDSLLRKNGYEV